MESTANDKSLNDFGNVSDLAPKIPSNNFLQRGYPVHLDDFDGPLDLLLQLVKNNELEISKIALAQVCQQYLDCIQNLPDLDLDVASEYLVIAATLVSIKSDLLLNKPVEIIENDETGTSDLHDELLRKLREVELYKNAAGALHQYKILDIDVFATKSQLKYYQAPDTGLAEHDMTLLVKAFHRILKKIDDRKVYKVVLDSVSIAERVSHIQDTLEKNSGILKVEDLYLESENKGELIGSFMAILELCKRQVVFVKQSGADADLMLYSRAYFDYDSLPDAESEQVKHKIAV